jgi:hypothetical protein
VVAIDADTSFDKLAAGVDLHATGSYWDLAGPADEQLDTFADSRTRLSKHTMSTSFVNIVDNSVNGACTGVLAPDQRPSA